MNILFKIDNLIKYLLDLFIYRHLSTKSRDALLRFDVYNRHKAITSRIKDITLSDKSILDVGGRKNSLREYLPLKFNGNLVVLNRDYNDLIGPNNHKTLTVQADGAFLPFADDTFEIATSITTLEHIEKKDRSLHIQELLRVCRGKIIIYAPFGPEGDYYEKKLYKLSLDEHVKFMTKQHIDNGLPTLKEIRPELPGCTIIPIQNARLWMYCMILKQVPILKFFLPSIVYSILKNIKTKPFYEYLIEYDKKINNKLLMEKPNILVISKCLPRFDRGSGHVRMFEIIKLLLKSYNVIFASESFSISAEINDEKYASSLRNLGVVVYTGKLKWKEIEKAGFDLVLISWYETAARKLPIIRKKFPAIPVIVDSVDVHFARELQMAEIHKDQSLREKAFKTKQKELAIYREADQVWTVTDADKQILQQNEQDLEIHIIPNIHDCDPTDRSQIQPNSLLFIGNFLHRPNVDAVQYFLRSIFPKILKKKPETILYIVGNAPPEDIKALSSDSVIVTGWVPETRPYLEKCHLAVVPLRYGAGLKGKVGEAMMAGIPVVTTSVGTQGMDVKDGIHLLLRDTDEKFAEGVISLLDNRDLCNKLSENSINYIKQRYSPAEVEKGLVSSLSKFLR